MLVLALCLQDGDRLAVHGDATRLGVSDAHPRRCDGAERRSLAPAVGRVETRGADGDGGHVVEKADADVAIDHADARCHADAEHGVGVEVHDVGEVADRSAVEADGLHPLGRDDRELARPGAEAEVERPVVEAETMALPGEGAHPGGPLRCGDEVVVVALAVHAEFDEATHFVVDEHRQEQREYALGLGPRADGEDEVARERGLVLRAVGRHLLCTGARDADHPPVERAPEERLRDLHGVDAARWDRVVARGEEAPADADSVWGGRDAVVERGQDLADGDGQEHGA